MNDPLYDGGFDGGGDDPQLAQLEDALKPLRHEAPMRALPEREPEQRSTPSGYWLGLGAAAAAIALVFVWPDPERDAVQEGEPVAVVTPEATQPEVPEAPIPEEANCLAHEAGFTFAASSGVTCDGSDAESGVMPVGAWLETPEGASANVELADIGRLTLFEHSRLRLVGTGPDEHRLELAQGRIHAEVIAPPRLFVVDTPAGTAVDLGCEYELSVDDKKRTHLKVEFGAVSMEMGEQAVWVPAGHEVVSTPGKGAGLPLALDAKPKMREAAARFDGGDSDALAALLDASRPEDMGTLWNLFVRTADEDRKAVYGRLNKLHPHPKSADRGDLLAGDATAMNEWRQSLEAATFE